MTTELRSGMWMILLAACAMVPTGCGKSGERELLDLAQASVTASLEAWKQGQPAESLKSSHQGLEFFDDDWMKGARLTNYRLVRSFVDTDGLAKCAVELSLQAEGSPASTLTVTYQLAKKPHVVISRDPFN